MNPAESLFRLEIAQAAGAGGRRGGREWRIAFPARARREAARAAG